jgi:hypothetical protein
MSAEELLGGSFTPIPAPAVAATEAAAVAALQTPAASLVARNIQPPRARYASAACALSCLCPQLPVPSAVLSHTRPMASCLQPRGPRRAQHPVA